MGTVYGIFKISIPRFDQKASYSCVKVSGILGFQAFLLLAQAFPLVKFFLLVEARVVQFVAFVAHKQVVAQDLRVVQLVFQFNDVRTEVLDLVLQRLDAGAQLGAAARGAAGAVSCAYRAAKSR